MDHSEATSVLLSQIAVERLNDLAADGTFEAPVSGDDLAFRRADLGVNAHPTPQLAEPEHAVCTSCGDDTDAPDDLSRCCGSQVTYPGPENDDKRSLTWL